MRLQTLSAAGALGAAVLVGVTGCGGATGSTAAPVASAPQAPVSAPAPAGWRPTTADRGVLEQAEWVLVAGCIRRVGFEYWPDTRPRPRQWELPYVIDDPAWARAHGTGRADQRRLEATVQADPNVGYVDSLPRRRQLAYDRALAGTNPDAVAGTTPNGERVTTSDTGCLADARRALYGDLPTWYAADTVDLHLRQLVIPRTLADPRYRQKAAGWACCVRAAGYRAGSPAELRALLEQSSDQPVATADRRELTLAVVEATCAARSGLGAIARTLDRQYLAAAERRYTSMIKPLRAMQYAALPRATKLVGDHADANG